MTDDYPDNDTPLGQAKDWLAAHMEDGVACPLCTQFAKVYKRKLNSGMARVLIAMHRKAGTDYLYLPHVDYKVGEKPRTVGHSGEMCMLRHWGLIEQYPNLRREDGSSRVGWWRLTELGEKFVCNVVKVRKVVVLYDNVLMDLTGPMISITDALGSKFNYNELMGYTD